MSLPAAPRKIWVDWSLLAALGSCVVATVLRIMPLGESLWLDELHTAWCAVGQLDEVAQRAAIGNQSPVFYWMEWALFGILGEAEFSLRFISLLAGALLPAAIFLLARRGKAEVAGLIAAALIAVDPLAIFYGTEARPYALVQLLVVGLAALTSEVTCRPTWMIRGMWILVAATVFHLHYTAILAVVAMSLFLALSQLFRSEAGSYGWVHWLTDQALLLLLCLPAAGNVNYIFAHRANWETFVKPQPIWNAIDWTPLPGWCWLILFIAAALAWLSQRSASALPQRLFWLALIWAAVPLAIAWVTTVSDFARLFFPRYLSASLPAAALCAGLCIQMLPLRSLRVVAGVLTIGIAIWTSGIIGHYQKDGSSIAKRNEDWRGCVDWLNERIAVEGYPVLVYSGFIEADELTKPHHELLDAYCVLPVNSLYVIDASPEDLFPLPMRRPGQTPQPAEMLCMHRGGCWIVARGNKALGQRVAEEVCDKLNPIDSGSMSERWSVRQTQSFGNVQLLFVTNASL